MAGLIFAPSARRDLVGIFDFIAHDKPAAAANWIDKIEAKCRLIATTPELGERRPEYGADIRSSVLGRYVIFYRSMGDGIEVVRAIAGDRDIQSLRVALEHGFRVPLLALPSSVVSVQTTRCGSMLIIESRFTVDREQLRTDLAQRDGVLMTFSPALLDKPAVAPGVV